MQDFHCGHSKLRVAAINLKKKKKKIVHAESWSNHGMGWDGRVDLNQISFCNYACALVSKVQIDAKIKGQFLSTQGFLRADG